MSAASFVVVVPSGERSRRIERQAWCYLQVKLCDPCLSALCVPWCKKALYKYSSFPFLLLAEGEPAEVAPVGDELGCPTGVFFIEV